MQEEELRFEKTAIYSITKGEEFLGHIQKEIGTNTYVFSPVSNISLTPVDLRKVVEACRQLEDNGRLGSQRN